MTSRNILDTTFTHQAGIAVPIICGPMYPCSNPELVAAVSDAGGLGIVQPVSLTYVHGYDFVAGLRYIRSLTSQPIGMNALIEKSSRRYHERMVRWVEQALEEGVRFFITSLGNPDWVVKRVHAVGGLVYHDVTERKWACKGHDTGVDGLIAVNNRAGGHAGMHSAQQLYDELADLALPLICAGGIGCEVDFLAALRTGYAGVQMGTRFIATDECKVPSPYKTAIVRAHETDIVLTERLTGIPVSVIRTPYIEHLGLKTGPFERWMLHGRKRKYLMRMLLFLRALRQLKQAVLDDSGAHDYWQAGKSVTGINNIKSAAEIVNAFAKAAKQL
jgi:nitronate monooxygenase